MSLRGWPTMLQGTLTTNPPKSPLFVQAPPHPAHRVIARLANQPCSKAFNRWVQRYEDYLYARRSASHFANRGLSMGEIYPHVHTHKYMYYINREKANVNTPVSNATTPSLCTCANRGLSMGEIHATHTYVLHTYTNGKEP